MKRQSPASETPLDVTISGQGSGISDRVAPLWLPRFDKNRNQYDMKRLIFLVASAIFAWSITGASAQNFSLQQIPDLYGGFDVPAQGGAALPYQLACRIVADPDTANRAYIVVEMQVAPGWHVYSVTQPKGGSMPTAITPEESPKYRQIGRFAPNAAHVVKWNDIFGMADEIHEGTVLWLAPIEILEGARENLVVNLTVKGQVCDEAVTSCLPVNKNLSASFDARDMKAAIATAREQAERLGFEWPLPGQAMDHNAVQNLIQPTTKPSLNLDAIEADEVVKAQGIVTALLWAFLGGMILNVMPCVLPVIGLKILSFFEQAGKNRARAFLLNVWYSLGMLIVFLVLAALSVGLSKMFTHSLFGIIMCCVVFALALSLMEVWELRAPIFLGTGKSQQLMRQEGAIGAMFKGVITTLLAIPCGAPLLSPALAWADIQVRNGSQVNVFLAYAVIGLGMASPYLVIGAFPELIRFLPKPGPWMDTFKKIMGFVLLSAVIWILYFLPLEAAVPTLALLFAVWFGCWYIGRLPFTANTPQRLRAWAVSLLVFAVVLSLSFPVISPVTLQGAMENKLEKWGEKNLDRLSQKKHWSGFSMAKLEKNLADGKVVIVDFTADWCTSCKWIESSILHDKKVLDKIDEKGIVTLQADWTDGDEAITLLLRRLGGEQVPVIAIFNPREPNKPVVFRGELTTQGTKPLLDQLDKLP
ncbi:MAG: thioredoxin family protein [Planctomycetaceae bacterium]|nr:thioredoxin family protein [Planctomycetaceae bacterium]